MLTLDQLTDIIAQGEQLDVEFKSDRRNSTFYGLSKDDVERNAIRKSRTAPVPGPTEFIFGDNPQFNDDEQRSYYLAQPLCR